MDKVKVLVEGYAYTGEDGKYYASCTTTLIETSDGKKFIVDPGTNGEKLLLSLKENEIELPDVKMVYLTHYHPDHFMNIKLFPNADLYDGSMLWQADREVEYSGKIPNTDIEILLTPGHTPEHSSLLVRTSEGLVCIAQDVFWWENGKQDTSNFDVMINKEDPFCTDFDALKQSRKRVLEVADVIIPGHGKIFENIFN